MLREDYRVTVGRETVRLWLREADLAVLRALGDPRAAE
ncbi:hypothetical protein FRUB_07819 [Fimbriiglobus ruber]|uniref:Uncharacterized protein n=1 Tax=Fimbriiglobus ruber TaxID=1908690 RepID=A0A225DNA1_9BACT|nr:hypothetical protein FRUB_07819 [Fimbriiglobus ruber]